MLYRCVRTGSRPAGHPLRGPSPGRREATLPAGGARTVSHGLLSLLALDTQNGSVSNALAPRWLRSAEPARLTTVMARVLLLRSRGEAR
jgi:hypothetical protein